MADFQRWVAAINAATAEAKLLGVRRSVRRIWKHRGWVWRTAAAAPTACLPRQRACPDCGRTSHGMVCSVQWNREHGL